jgi:hypothetical protein
MVRCQAKRESKAEALTVTSHRYTPSFLHSLFFSQISLLELNTALVDLTAEMKRLEGNCGELQEYQESLLAVCATWV